MGNVITETSITQAVTILNRGGCLVYPTETFYALGGSSLSSKAIERVCQLKSRLKAKPLPLIIGDWQHLFQITEEISPELKLLADNFWPGPLSILVPAKDSLHSYLKDGTGDTCLRLTSHPVAARLSQCVGNPLISTSANKSGDREVNRLDRLDSQLRRYVDAVIELPPWPKGGLPSTIVKIVGPDAVQVLRPGAVSIDKIRGLGFIVKTK